MGNSEMTERSTDGPRRPTTPAASLYWRPSDSNISLRRTCLGLVKNSLPSLDGPRILSRLSAIISILSLYIFFISIKFFFKLIEFSRPFLKRSTFFIVSTPLLWNSKRFLHFLYIYIFFVCPEMKMIEILINFLAKLVASNDGFSLRLLLLHKNDARMLECSWDYWIFHFSWNFFWL